MAKMINFGIDLGTTNSLMARFNNGVVEVFKNPNGFKETLPSVVGFRNERILVGEQARVYAEKDPKSTVAQFKRKMGTTECYTIRSLGQSKTPTELSAFVLKELKTFVHSGESVESVVITIPASFDMVQSNATKEAGYAAGFKQVVLLQEPIAASLAYANKEKQVDLKNSQWIVYDLGGGTFDVALVRIMEGELKVVDHEGDNYLGGADFDAAIVEKVIAPQLAAKGTFRNLISELKSESGKYNRLWYKLLHIAEQAKIELSARTSADIEVTVDDDNGTTIDILISMTRSELENVIKDAVDGTAAMLKKILTRNSLRAQDLKFILMVGGSTYTPYVRRHVEELLGIPVNTGIDPTNAIVVGAAYYAATKEVTEALSPGLVGAGATGMRLKVSYNRASQELDEMFSAKADGDVSGLSYRIVRADGGYDSGVKQMSARISEDLPLQPDTYNFFTLTLYDKYQQRVSCDCETIQIAQGKYSVAGQLLPEDISLVKDDLNTGDTKLDRIFAKNAVLPAKCKKIVDASKVLTHGSDDELRVIVVEGPVENHSSANRMVGHLSISGRGLKRDILRGTEIDLTFELSESRDLKVQAFINPSGPEFSEVFTPTLRKVDVKALSDEVAMLDARCEQEKRDAIEHENYEVAEQLEKMRSPVRELQVEAMLLSVDDVTDGRFKLEDRKRKIAQELSKLTSGKVLERLRAEYQTAKTEVTEIVTESGNDQERRQLHDVVSQEAVFLVTTIPQRIELQIVNLRRLGFQILRRTPAFLVSWFRSLSGKREILNDQVQARHLIEAGKQHIASEDYERLSEVNMRLHSLLPESESGSKEMRHFTGIS